MNEGQQQLLEAIDENGEVGFIDSAAQSSNRTNDNTLAVRLGDGAMIFAATDRFAKIGENKFLFKGSFSTLRLESAEQISASENQADQNRRNLAEIDAHSNERGEIVVPLIAEEVSISKKTVETGGVRVHKTVREEVRTIDEPIIREHLDIERVEINQFVEAAPAVRYEGDVMIVPVLEEVVVTQKRLLLREEIRLTKRREEISNPQQITLRSEEINLEKIETDEAKNIESGTPER